VTNLQSGRHWILVKAILRRIGTGTRRVVKSNGTRCVNHRNLSGRILNFWIGPQLGGVICSIPCIVL